MATERIVFATQGPGGLDDIVSPVFGRCPTFTIVDIDNGQVINVTVQQNPAMNAIGGAGMQAAQIIASSGANAVVAGNFGPNATQALMSLGIQMIPGISGVSVKDAIDMYLKKQFTTPTTPMAPSTYPYTPAPMPMQPSTPMAMPVSQPTYNKELEIKMLKIQKEMIEKQIEVIKKRLEELK